MLVIVLHYIYIYPNTIETSMSMLCVSRTPTVLLRQCVSKGLNLKTTTVDQQLLPQHS